MIPFIRLLLFLGSVSCDSSWISLGQQTRSPTDGGIFDKVSQHVLKAYQGYSEAKEIGNESVANQRFERFMNQEGIISKFLSKFRSQRKTWFFSSFVKESLGSVWNWSRGLGYWAKDTIASTNEVAQNMMEMTILERGLILLPSDVSSAISSWKTNKIDVDSYCGLLIQASFDPVKSNLLELIKAMRDIVISEQLVSFRERDGNVYVSLPVAKSLEVLSIIISEILPVVYFREFFDNCVQGAISADDQTLLLKLEKVIAEELRGKSYKMQASITLILAEYGIFVPLQEGKKPQLGPDFKNMFHVLSQGIFHKLDPRSIPLVDRPLNINEYKVWERFVGHAECLTPDRMGICNHIDSFSKKLTDRLDFRKLKAFKAPHLAFYKLASLRENIGRTGRPLFDKNLIRDALAVLELDTALFIMAYAQFEFLRLGLRFFSPIFNDTKIIIKLLELEKEMNLVQPCSPQGTRSIILIKPDLRPLIQQITNHSDILDLAAAFIYRYTGTLVTDRDLMKHSKRSEDSIETFNHVLDFYCAARHQVPNIRFQ